MSRRWLSPCALFLASTWPAWMLLAGLPEPDRLVEQSLFAFALGLAFLAVPLAQRTLWATTLAVFPAAAVWGVFAHEFGGPPHSGTLIALMHSNLAENREWMTSHALQSLMVGALAAGSVAMFIYAPRTPVFGRQQRRKISAALLMLALVAFLQHDYWYGKRSSWALITSTDIEAIWPAGPLWKISDALWSRLPDAILAPPEFVNLDRAAPLAVKNLVDGPLAVVFVIGESDRTDTLNPIRRPDLTRELALRLADKRMAWLGNVCAGATLTLYSVPALVTGAGPDEAVTKARSLPSGLAYFRQAGFSTAWISNQDDGIFGESGWDLGIFARRTSAHKPDETLLPDLTRFLHSSGRVAAVVHLQGSHFDYVNRYPADAALIPVEGLTGLALERAHYANSEAYTASVLARILRLIDQDARPAVVLFTSDHGENLKDDARNLWRHAGSKQVSAAEIKVPAFVAWNQAYARLKPESLANIGRNAELPLAHTNFFPLWLRLGGLESAAAPESDSPDASSFTPRVERSFRNTANGQIESCESVR
ncbi:MAG: sulfatase-like hydrolase/transferase [Proteobacteria bacterium]|nr:sulfatase-like hydrolase/transferase [Pseudomonadota bacterium]